MVNSSYAGWYKSKQWQKFRADFLRTRPLCRMCLDAGRVTRATTVDHVLPHRGDRGLFWDRRNLQSLCLLHANAEKQRIEKGGIERTPISVEGWPKEKR